MITLTPQQARISSPCAQEKYLRQGHHTGEKRDLRLQQYRRSEQQHTDAVAHLLELRHRRPGYDTGVRGVRQLDLQALYDDLIAQGSKSVEEALKVGAAIEEIDIMDLEERLADVTNAEVSRVFENPTFGSENHLRAFAMNIETQTGEPTPPRQYMVQADYDEIVDADGSTGGAMGRLGAAGGRGGQEDAGSSPQNRIDPVTSGGSRHGCPRLRRAERCVVYDSSALPVS